MGFFGFGLEGGLAKVGELGFGGGVRGCEGCEGGLEGSEGGEEGVDGGVEGVLVGGDLGLERGHCGGAGSCKGGLLRLEGEK